MKSPSFRPEPSASSKRAAQFSLQAMAIDSRFSNGSISQESTISPGSLAKHQLNDSESERQIIVETNMLDSPMKTAMSPLPALLAGAFGVALAGRAPKQVQVKAEDVGGPDLVDDDEVKLESDSSNGNENIEEVRPLPSLQGSLAVCALQGPGDSSDGSDPKRFFRFTNRESGISSFAQSANFGHRSNMQIKKSSDAEPPLLADIIKDAAQVYPGRMIIEELESSQVVAEQDFLETPQVDSPTAQARQMSVMNIASLGQPELSVSPLDPLQQQNSTKRPNNMFKLNLVQAQIVDHLETPQSSKKTQWGYKSVSSHHMEDDTVSNFTGYGVVPYKQIAGQGSTQYARVLMQRQKD